MYIYLAAGLNRRDEMRSIHATLENVNHTMTSEWVHLDETYKDVEDEQLRQRRLAEMDYRGIDRAEMVVFFCDKPSTHGGYHVELGIAETIKRHRLKRGAWALTLGLILPADMPLPNIFYSWADETWDSPQEFIRSMLKRGPK